MFINMFSILRLKIEFYGFKTATVLQLLSTAIVMKNCILIKKLEKLRLNDEILIKRNVQKILFYIFF